MRCGESTPRTNLGETRVFSVEKLEASVAWRIHCFPSFCFFVGPRIGFARIKTATAKGRSDQSLFMIFK